MFSFILVLKELDGNAQNGFVDLVLHGVDTIANISINDHVLGTTNNMFDRYVFSVGKYMKVSCIFVIICCRSI